MSCLDANTLALLVDGGIDDTARDELESHLDGCAGCAEWVASLGALLAPPDITAWARGKSREQIDAEWLAVADSLDLRHLAPEVLRGEPATPASVQFTSCAGWWEARHGAPPFRGATPGALLVSIAAGAELPADADRITRVLMRGLALDPARRWPDLAAATRHARSSFVTRLCTRIARTFHRPHRDRKPKLPPL